MNQIPYHSPNSRSLIRTILWLALAMILGGLAVVLE